MHDNDAPPHNDSDIKIITPYSALRMTEAYDSKNLAVIDGSNGVGIMQRLVAVLPVHYIGGGGGINQP